MIRRAWSVLTDPPASDLAAFLRNVALPVGVLLFVARLLVHPALGPGLTELVWMVALLTVVRQRDRARAELAAARRAESASPAPPIPGHQPAPERPPTTATHTPAHLPAITTRHRNEDT